MCSKAPEKSELLKRTTTIVENNQKLMKAQWHLSAATAMLRYKVDEIDIAIQAITSLENKDDKKDIDLYFAKEFEEECIMTGDILHVEVVDKLVDLFDDGSYDGHPNQAKIEQELKQIAGSVQVNAENLEDFNKNTFIKSLKNFINGLQSGKTPDAKTLHDLLYEMCVIRDKLTSANTQLKKIISDPDMHHINE